MRGVVLAVVILAAAFAGPAVSSAAPQQTEQAATPTGAVDPADLADRSPEFAPSSPATNELPDTGTSGPQSAFVDRVEGVERSLGGTAPVTVTHDLNLTPARPGELRVELRVRRRAVLANRTANLSVGLSRRATVINATGFHHVEDRYRLNASDDTATITYRLKVNRTAAGGGYEAVDAGPWALVRTPKPSVSARDVAIDRRYEVDGEGVVHDGLTYLGPHRTYNRTVHDQRLRLVVPAVAEMRARPTVVMDSLSTAAGDLSVGERDDSVLFVAAPTTVDWAHAAQQVGDADAWVQADQSLYDPRNAWFHEYVHTRQAFRTTRETRWLVEGTATYYAALLSLRQGLIDFDEFRRHLLVGTAPRNSQAVLADPGTWSSSRAEYRKGALVVGELDRRARRSSGGWRSFQWVFSRLNAHDGRVKLSTVGSLLGAVGGNRLRATTRRYATESTVPPTWSAGAHRAVFGWGPPELSTGLVEVTAAGRGGHRSLDDDPDEVVVLTDERLVATVRARNDGDRRASVVTPFQVNFTTVNRTVDRVAPDGWTTTTVSHRFSEPGSYYVVVGGEAIRVRVVEPTRSVGVTDVSVDPGGDERDGAVTVVTQVRNRKDRPARLSLPVTVDGEVVTTRTVAVGPNQVRRVEATVQLNRSGTHQVAVAGRGTAVNVSDSGEVLTPTSTGMLDARSLSSTPREGWTLGLLAVLFAVVAGVTLCYRRTDSVFERDPEATRRRW